MLFRILRSLVFGLASVMMLPAVALATLGVPDTSASPFALAGWVVVAGAALTLVYVFVNEALLDRLVLEPAPPPSSR